jgi:hypothetical protein
MIDLKFKIEGVLEFYSKFLEELKSRKLVGLFTDLKSAEEDILMMYAQDLKVDFNDLEYLWNELKLFMNIQRYWDEL